MLALRTAQHSTFSRHTVHKDSTQFDSSILPSCCSLHLRPQTARTATSTSTPTHARVWATCVRHAQTCRRRAHPQSTHPSHPRKDSMVESKDEAEADVRTLEKQPPSVLSWLEGEEGGGGRYGTQGGKREWSRRGAKQAKGKGQRAKGKGQRARARARASRRPNKRAGAGARAKARVRAEAVVRARARSKAKARANKRVCV
mmetsp:Transcript_31200/g.67019  ORF Transcript_31200/g.67019 Transcript_31200/m.67019 type:complete len:201 (+) Transcript_31200:121-723(+)